MSGGRRKPIDVSSQWRPRSAHVDEAIRAVRGSGVLPPLRTLMDATTGRPRYLSVEALLVGMMLNGLTPGHRALISRIAAAMGSLSTQRLRELGCRVDRPPADLYKRVDALYNHLCRTLAAGHDVEVDGRTVPLDDVWFANRIGISTVGDASRLSRAVAMDGTAMHTAATLSGERVVVDGEATGRGGRAKERLQPRDVGADGRNVYTADPDARAGYKTATSRDRASTYVGYELHLAVLTREVVWTDGIAGIALGPPVPGLIVTSALSPANTHRAEHIVPALLEHAPHVTDVVVDPGYSLTRPETFALPLRRAGVHVTFRITTHQETTRPFSANAFILNGQLFSETLPARLRKLPLPPTVSDASAKHTSEDDWNEAARYRFTLHGRMQPDGTIRLRDPIHAGRLRAAVLPRSLGRGRHLPRVTVPDPDGWTGTVTVAATDLPLQSRYVTGTTAHRIAYFSRRQIVESANGALQHTYTRIRSGHHRVFRTHKIQTLLAFTIAGYNADRLKEWRRQHGTEPDLPHQPALEDDEFDWDDALDPDVTPAGTDPPA